MKPELKKLLVLNLPYLLFVYLFAKCGQAYRLAAGVDASAKLLHLTDGISAAFANPLPSLHPFDLCVGVVTWKHDDALDLITRNFVFKDWCIDRIAFLLFGTSLS